MVDREDAYHAALSIQACYDIQSATEFMSLLEPHQFFNAFLSVAKTAVSETYTAS